MVTSTNAQLGKLLASYLSTSNDALAITFRRHYAPTPILTSPRKTPAKRPAPRVTNATFTYRWLATAPQRITKLYQFLLRAQWIASDTNPDDFFSLFTGKESNVRIKWTGSNLQLAYLIRVITEQNYISTPKRVGKFPVEKVHGKLAKSHKIGFAHRVASKLNYSTAYGVRSTAPTSKEIAHRKKFGEVAVQTTARLKDPMYIAADQAAFKAQTKYKTLRQYVFNVLLQEYAPE